MTDDELRKEATYTVEWESTPMIDRPLFVHAYITGAKPREKRISELEKENARMKKDGDDLSKRFDYQVKRVMELEKANEWHYPSKGEYPEEYEDIFICFNNDGIEDYVRGWYEYDSENNKHIFKYVDMLGTHYLTIVYAWKYFTYPKIHEEMDK